VEKYIHRIGRIDRAAREGEAFTLITQKDQSEVSDIEKVLGKKIEQCKLENFNYATTPPTRTFMPLKTNPT
jgi:ATP-dependent RNA helicase RhlE